MMGRSLRSMLNRYEPASMQGLGLPVEQWEDARGAKVSGRIDFTSGLLVANIGHDRDEIVDALRNTRDWTAWYSPTPRRLNAYRALASVLPWRKFVLLNSGSEAIDCAIKVCRDNGYEPVALPFHYWGSTIGASALADAVASKEGTKVAWFLQAFHGPTCRWLDTYQAAHYLSLQLAGDILVFDENQAGVGRTGRWWGYQWLGIDPDIVVGGKAIAGGVTCAFVAGKPKLMDTNPKADYPSTFSANAFACEAMIETLRIMKAERLVSRAHTIGQAIERWTDTLGMGTRKGMVGIHGRGAAWAIAFDKQSKVDAIAARCLKDGLIVMNTYQRTVKIAPPLVITDTQLEHGLSILRRAIEEETR